MPNKGIGEFIALTDLPRASVANALQVQGRTDYTGAAAQVMFAFTDAARKVSGAGGKITEFRDAVASARLAINNACDLGLAAMADAERMFQTGVDLQAEDADDGQADGESAD